MSAIVVIGMHTTMRAQSVDEERMRRDIEVAENVLATLIKQELQQGNTFFGLDVRGSYQPGYGVTFRVPTDQSLPFVINIPHMDMRPAVITGNNGRRYTVHGEPPPPPDVHEEAEISEGC